MFTYKTALIPWVLAACLSLPRLGFAQQSDVVRDKTGNFNNGYALAPPEANTLQGSPFLLPQWQPATVFLAPAGRPPITVPLKYDVYQQELRVRRPQGDSVIVPLGQVREFSLTNTSPARRFVCYPAASLPAEAAGPCAEVLANGEHAQLVKFVRKVAMKQATENSGYVSNTSMNVLTEQTQYYLHWPADGHFVPLRLKRASLEQALAGQPAAQAALKARKGSLGSEAEVAAAVLALDPLLTAPSH